MLPTVHAAFASWHLAVSLYDVALALAVALGVAIAVRRAVDPDVVLVAAPLVALAGVAAAEGWHRLLHASPGLSSMGGIAGGLGATALLARIGRVPARRLLDALAPGAVAALAVGRIGCFLAGCCYGRVTTAWWGVVLPSIGSEARHPVQLAEAALDLVVAWWSGRARVAGLPAARAAIGYAAARMLLEPLRDPSAADVLTASGLSAVPWGALALVLLGLGLMGRGAPRFGLDPVPRSATR